MKAAQYAEALYNAAEGKSEEASTVLVENLVKLLQRQNHVNLLPEIVREYEKIERVRSTERGASLRVADAQDRERHAAQIAADAETLGISAETCTIQLDPTVVGGYALEARGKRIDRTHKRTLLELYNNLITSAQHV